MEGTREECFAALVAQVQACRACPRMEGRRRVFGPANGALRPRAVVVAEAPGRLGGERHGVPLLHDQTGRTFTALLSGAGIDRAALFITNAIACAPLAEGKNDTPTAQEVRRCSPHLGQALAVLDPPLVVALGAVALRALALICPHQIILRRDVATPHPWHGRTLLPLYHPGPRALIHRPLARQHDDYAVLARLLDAGRPCSAARDR